MRILYFTADARFAEDKIRGSLKEYADLKLWSELEKVTSVLYDARAEGRVELTVVPETDRDDVRRYLNELPVEVVHFSGHGDRVSAPQQSAAQGGADNTSVVIEPGTEQGEQDNAAAASGEATDSTSYHLILMGADHEGLFGEYSSSEWIREQLRGKGVKLVVLNCCWSDGVARTLLDAVDCVIGTAFDLKEDLAAEFAELLYRDLERGLTMRQIQQRVESTQKFGNYRIRVREDSLWDQALAPIPPDQRKPTPPRMVLERRAEAAAIKTSHRSQISSDLLKLAFAGVVAFLGWLIFSGSAGLIGSWQCPEGEACVPVGPLEILQFLAAKATWLRWEPAAIMTAVCANPMGRLASILYVELGLAATILALKKLSLKAPAAIERYLANGRIDAMLRWLRESV